MNEEVEQTEISETPLKNHESQVLGGIVGLVAVVGFYRKYFLKHIKYNIIVVQKEVVL